jgi:hypothetical protein
MKRNSGLIGPRQSTVLTSAPGVFDTFDAYNSRRINTWPLSFRYNSLSPSSGTILENTVANFVLDASGFESNTTLFFSVGHITSTSADFFNSVTSGSFTQNSSTNTGSFSLTTAFIGNTGKSTKTFQVQIRTGSTFGPVVFTSGTFSIPAITSTVSWSATPINEGVSTNLQVALGNMGTFSAWTANINYSGSASSADFSAGLPSTMLIGGGTFSSTYSAINDITTEGTETLTATVSYIGNTLGAATLTISDTSQNATATVIPNITSSNEDGTNIVVTVNTTGFASGTLFFTVLPVSGSVTATDFTQGVTSGSFSVASSTGNFTLTVAADLVTEGAETFQLQVRVNSTVGAVIGTSAVISINDTSLTPGAPSYVTLGTKAPTFGAGGSSVHPPAGWTSQQNASADDAFRPYTTPFSINVNNTSYSTHNIGSNTYITWGAGSTVFSNISASVPANNKLHMGAADNSYQRVSTFTSGTAYTRMRYEGNGSTSGTLGSPGIVLEVTIFNPADYGGVPVIEILVGNHNRTAGQTGIATPSAYMTTWSIAANTAYVLVGNAAGTAWARYNGFVNNSGY